MLIFKVDGTCNFRWFYFAFVYTRKLLLRTGGRGGGKGDLPLRILKLKWRFHVWTEVVSGRKKLRIQKYPDMCGRPGPESPTELSAVPYHLNYETIS